MERLLFVYGTLRRQSPHPMARYLAERAQFRGVGSIQAKLFDLGRYPGVIASDAAEDRVAGELFELDDPAGTLPELDEYEGCTRMPPLYERRIADVWMENGTTCSAWVYYYRGPSR